MAKGYLVFEIEVTDRETYERYRSLAAPILARTAGRFIARNGAVDTLEGGWSPKSFFILEFPSCAEARAFYYSKQYQEVLALRLAASKSRAILIEGCAP